MNLALEFVSWFAVFAGYLVLIGAVSLVPVAIIATSKGRKQ